MLPKSIKKTKKYFLIELLESFSKTEINHFSHFIASTYFNTDQWIIKLLDALRQHVIGKHPYDDLAQTKVYQTIFCDLNIPEALLDKKQKKLLGAKMSVLTKLAKRFLAIEALATTPACDNELLMTQFYNKKQFRLFTQLYKKKQRYLKEEKVKGIDYYALAFQVEKGYLNHLHQTGDLLNQDNFSALNNSLDLQYLLNKLKIYVTMLSVKNATKKVYDFTFMESIITLGKVSTYANHPLIITYLAVIKLIKTNIATNYFYLLKVLDQYKLSIPKSSLIDFYNVAGNFCIRQIVAGKNDFNRELFNLYQNMHRENLLLEGQFMQAVKIKSVVTIACKVREFNWANMAVNHYCPFVNKTVQKSVYHFNLGIIDFYQHHYKEAIHHFIRVEKVNLAYDLDCKLLLLQAYYLMDKHYDERTMQIFRSTGNFIYTHKTMPTTSKKSYKNFILILTNLYQVRHRMGKRTIELVHKKLEDMDVVLARQWLSTQIEVILKASRK
ncbi:MAG: hypothetical protein AB8G86_15595 [Saprospiraceae bacterium]